ncbi:FdhD protein [Anaerosolibacter carboniphilus]|uniref:Sulfur carrier protein FdhD n=1 Tax=Anaerosolibacter carboniphilus TaxID=1417629 RepID=A0A841KXK3_9FIRM|nr:formate dehydrogenase accessory sulfurtransferase FdhD [Anaerosolibacter carboniphilus]MBB6214885.1 FdhD protein [Anaerosolibacter carboniphilus]
MSDEQIERKSNICEEAPVDLILNGQKLITFMCTPMNLNELAVGHLYSRRLIRKVEDILTLAACEDMKKIYVMTSNKINEDVYSVASVLTSSCGSGAIFTEKILNDAKNDSIYSIAVEKLKERSIEMLRKAELYKKMGGMHCACLSDGNEITILREDIGRHNAVDKIIGRGLFQGIDFYKTIIFTTGRISLDMVLKAAAAGFPIIVSRSIPSNLALDLAEKLGITIVGRVVSSQPIIYTHSQRVICKEEDRLMNECM